jgi:hypothetical protein
MTACPTIARYGRLEQSRLDPTTRGWWCLGTSFSWRSRIGSKLGVDRCRDTPTASTGPQRPDVWCVRRRDCGPPIVGAAAALTAVGCTRALDNGSHVDHGHRWMRLNSRLAFFCWRAVRLEYRRRTVEGESAAESTWIRGALERQGLMLISLAAGVAVPSGLEGGWLSVDGRRRRELRRRRSESQLGSEPERSTREMRGGRSTVDGGIWC